MPNNPRVFISHASEDNQRFVIPFTERLRAKGVDGWLDVWETLPGEKLVTKIFEHGMKQTDAVIVVLSAASVAKPWVRKELDTAIVKSIEDMTRIIPVRLDNCEVPECLRDTLWQEIPDPSSYDSAFERIVNAIYGQYDKPDLGKPPAYIRNEVLSIDGLARIDAAFLEAACRIALAAGSEIIDNPDQLVEELSRQGISEGQMIESQEILESRYYLSSFKTIGPPYVYPFEITTAGFDQFAHEAIPDYGKITAVVARTVVERVATHGLPASNFSIAQDLNQPIRLVDHIFRVLENNGRVRLSESLGGGLHLDVYWASPELRRELEGHR